MNGVSCEGAAARQRGAYAWVRLLGRIYAVLPLICLRCGGEMRLIAFITSPAAIVPILAHLGEAITPPPLAPRARAPPEMEAPNANAILAFYQSTPWDASCAPPEVGFTFNQE